MCVCVVAVFVIGEERGIESLVRRKKKQSKSVMMIGSDPRRESEREREENDCERQRERDRKTRTKT